MNRRGFLTASLALCAAGTLDGARAQTTARVVSIGGTVTECVYTLGMQGLLVGADTTSTFPPAAERLPRVGYHRALSAEGLLSLAPTLVLASTDAGPPATVEQLRRTGVRWVSLPVEHTPTNPVAMLSAIGEALGQPARAAERVSQYETAWREAAAQVGRLADRPRAVFVMAHGGPTLNLAGRDTAADALLGLAGLVNPLEFTRYKTISPEALVAAAPDVIVTTTQSLSGLGGAQAILARPGLAATPAARNRRIVALDALLLLGFGPRLPQAVTQLARLARGLS